MDRILVILAYPLKPKSMTSVPGILVGVGQVLRPLKRRVPELERPAGAMGALPCPTKRRDGRKDEEGGQEGDGRRGWAKYDEEGEGKWWGEEGAAAVGRGGRWSGRRGGQPGRS